jgi:hypothetical protein
MGWHGLSSSGSLKGQVAGSCECDNEPSGSIKCGELLDCLRTGYFIREDSVPWSFLVSYLGSQLWI